MDTDPQVALLAAAIRAAAGALIRRVRLESGTALTWSQSALLSAIARRGRATASELAVENDLRTQTVWSSLITLERRGLVTRERDATDRRSVYAALTDQGQKELIADRQIRQDWIATVLEREFDAGQREILRQAVPLIVRLAESGGTDDPPDDNRPRARSRSFAP